MNEDDVRKAVLPFPAGSAGGTDSLRPRHLRDMVYFARRLARG